MTEIHLPNPLGNATIELVIRGRKIMTCRVWKMHDMMKKLREWKDIYSLGDDVEWEVYCIPDQEGYVRVCVTPILEKGEYQVINTPVSKLQRVKGIYSNKGNIEVEQKYFEHDKRFI